MLGGRGIVQPRAQGLFIELADGGFGQRFNDLNARKNGPFVD